MTLRTQTLREEWKKADFLKDVPYDAEAIKNAIADWWIDKLSQTLAQERKKYEIEKIKYGIDVAKETRSFYYEKVRQEERAKVVDRVEKFMEDYKFHAGVWHEDSCDFPEVDHAVCNCNHAKIRKLLRTDLQVNKEK